MATEVASREAYVGEKHKQIREGYGIYTYENKFFRYEGEWMNGRKHGHGKFIMADGTYYEGEFQHGEIEGHGYKLFASSGNTYSGEFHLGELHGQGVMTYANGGVYEGEWCRNRREGYGVLRELDSSVYQGYLHNHKRHGEGTQLYENGDRYDGDWVNDLRQGHGELKMVNGTIYDGQWRNNLYNGQGTMTHASGIIYEGIWINGFPAKIATKLTFKGITDDTLEVFQGATFSLEVVTVDEEGEIIEEQGREIQIMAGFKHVVPKEDKSKENSSTGLFDVIEDVEETPIETPFGYSIVSYPLTDQINPEEFLSENSMIGIGRSRTDLSETVVPENEVLASAPEAAKRADTEDLTKAEDNKEKTDKEPTSSDLETPSQLVEDSTLPQSISNQRTDVGSVSFQNLTLPSAPPLYRPYVVMAMEEERKESRGSKSKPGSRQSKKDGDDPPESRPSTKAKKYGDERFARPGEYVVMAQEVTKPPFMDSILEPVFLKIKVTVPKKPPSRKRSNLSLKNQGPKK